ncbi:uncharacterized protein TNCV_1538431 [Trichonephila clavipes]|nr:uncharacterized protein TNCV_1538431 [Trichonephila clavipes]
MKLTYITWILILIGFSKAEERKPFETISDKEINVLKEIIDASVFYDKYVRVGVPVLMKHVAKDIFDEIFNPENIPQLFTTYLEVKNKNDGSSTNMSFHQFQNIHEQGMVYIDSAIPTVIKSRIPVPQILLCKPLIENMMRTRLRIPAGEWRYDVEKSSHDRIIFQFGSSKVHLFTSSQAMAGNDAEQFESERTTEQFTASLVSGDALFIPAGW